MTSLALPWRIVRKERWAIPQPALLLLAQLAQAAGPYAAILITGFRFGLSEVGQFAYAQALSLPVFQFLSLQLKPLLLTHTARELPLSAALRLRWATSLLGLLWICALLPQAGLICVLAAALRWIENWSEIYQAHWQKDGAAARVLGASLLRTLSLALCIVLAPKLVDALMLSVFSSAAILLFIERVRGEAPLGSFSFSPILRRGLLLGFVLFLSAFQASIPRLALEKWATLEALGRFATLSVVLQIGTLASSSLGQALLPRLQSASPAEIHRWLAFPFAAAAVVLLASYSVPLPITNAPLFRALCWSQLTLWPAAFIGCALTAKRKYRAQLFIVSSLAAISAVGAFLLVPRWGAVGAAYSLGLSGTAMLALSSLVLTRSSRP